MNCLMYNNKFLGRRDYDVKGGRAQELSSEIIFAFTDDFKKNNHSLFFHACVPTIFFMNIKKYIIHAKQTDTNLENNIFITNKDMIRNFALITDCNT